MATGCSGAYSGTHLSIVTSTGVIEADQDFEAGYTEPVCVKCYVINGADYTVYDNWEVRQLADCSKSI